MGMEAKGRKSRTVLEDYEAYRKEMVDSPRVKFGKLPTPKDSTIKKTTISLGAISSQGSCITAASSASTRLADPVGRITTSQVTISSDSGADDDDNVVASK